MRVTGQDLTSLITGLFSGRFRQNKRALWSANLLVYWVAFAFLAVLLVTGLALYREDLGLSQLLGGYGLMRTLHGLAAYVFLPYIILHVTLQWWFGQFWSIFRIQWHRPHLKAGLIGLAVSLVVVGGVYGWNQRLYTLTVPRITQASPPLLDGKPHDAAWQHAQSVTVRTVKGINNPHDFVDVDIKALHDGERIYFRLQWDDPAVSSKRFPLLKTAEGWKVLQTAISLLMRMSTTKTSSRCISPISPAPAVQRPATWASALKGFPKACITQMARRATCGIGNRFAPLPWGFCKASRDLWTINISGHPIHCRKRW